MDNYYWYLKVGWMLRLCLMLSLVLFGLAMASCATKGVQGTLNGTVVDPAISVGRSSAGTWNQTPHGGSDEKSNSAPSEPAS